MRRKSPVYVAPPSHAARDVAAADSLPAQSSVPRAGQFLGTIRSDPRVRVRLFAFPHAGGGASAFRGWSEAVPPSIEIVPAQLPGREVRIAERPFVRLAPLIRALAESMVPHLGFPFALFGNSMGALVCFELARYLRRALGVSPVHLFISAAPAPHLRPRHRSMHALPDPALLEELRCLAGTPDEVLRSDEVMRLLLPALRADLALVETYTYFPDAPLACPISAFGGLNDTRVTRGDLTAWRDQTLEPFTLRMVPGGHFFAYDTREPLVDAIISDLGRAGRDDHVKGERARPR